MAKKATQRCQSTAGWLAQRIKQADYTVAELTTETRDQRRVIVAQRQQIERLKDLLLRAGGRVPADLNKDLTRAEARLQ